MVCSGIPPYRLNRFFSRRLELVEEYHVDVFYQILGDTSRVQRNLYPDDPKELKEEKLGIQDEYIRGIRR